MIFIEPMSAQAVYLRSKIQETERKVFLGYFTKDINTKELFEAMNKEGVTLRLSIAEVGTRAQIISHPARISEGVIFETIEEFINSSLNGLRYEDIFEGHTRAMEMKNVYI